MALTDEWIDSLYINGTKHWIGKREIARAIESAACAERDARIEEQDETLRFVERWANHHATKPNMTPEEALSCIQHYPAIRAITHGYADGQMPETPNPWKQLRELQSYVAELERQLADARKDAERWATTVEVSEDVLRHPDKRKFPFAVSAYMHEINHGHGIKYAVDAAIRAMKEQT